LDKEKILKRSKFYYLCSFPVLKKLNEIDMPYAIIKSEPLSMYAYGAYGQRIFGDIDILLARQNLKLADGCLKQSGFYQTINDSKKLREYKIFSLASSHQTVSYKRLVGKYFIEIDINFDILWGEYTGKRIDISEFLSDSVEMSIYGCKIKTLSPLKTMIQIALHHYKDLNSVFLLATRKNIKYDMFKDVYYLLKNNLDEITLDKLYAMSSEYEIIPYVYYVLYYTGLLFKDEILERYVAAFKTPEGEGLLNCYGLNEAERREWKLDFQTRLESKNLYELIEADLSERDLRNIEINRKVFLGD
jgi:hypothetical protein